MRIVPNKNLRKSYVKRYWRETRKTLAIIRQPVIDMAEHTDPENLKAMIPHLLQIQPMVSQLQKIWGDVGGRFAYDTDRLINLAKKAAKKTLEEHSANMRTYAAERSLLKAKKILTTQQEAINKVIDDVIQEGLTEGLGVHDIRAKLKFDLEGEKMITMENWQAERIAMTEVGQANNTASFMAAREDAEGVKKIWMFIPGQKTFRENHKEFEAMGSQDMNYEFAPGLQFPGDENADAEEVINCYCSIGYETE
jgi:hypothetical protein